jgi:hypothetical protein
MRSRSCGAGDINCNQPGVRMQGHGPRWQVLMQLFAKTCEALGMRMGEGVAWPEPPREPEQRGLFE